MSIYTKAGDTGYTSTKNRMRIPKNSPVFKLLGTLDEFSSALGLAKQKLPQTIRDIVEQLQNDVILYNAEIAGGSKFATHDEVAKLETAIDSIMSTLPEIKAFVLPGATEGGAALDLARAVVRRAEREAVALSQTGGISRDSISWLNRISDLVYALARMTDMTATRQSQPAAQAPQAAPEEKPAPVSVPDVADAAPITGDQFSDRAFKLCDAVMAQARRQGLGVVTAVCDAGTNLVAFKRDDTAFLVSIDVAVNKAYTAASLKMTTEQVGKLTQPGEGLYGLQYSTLTDGDGKIVGALGVSGGTADQDKALAEYGAQLFKKGVSIGNGNNSESN